MTEAEGVRLAEELPASVTADSEALFTKQATGQQPPVLPKPGTGALCEALMSSGADFAALTAAMGDGQPVRCEPVRPLRWSEGFEALRDRSDAAVDTMGARPTIFLANLANCFR